MNHKDCLYIGPYRELNQTGRNSLSILNHLSKEKLNICGRPIFYNPTSPRNLDSVSCEANQIKNKDVLIQYDVITNRTCRLVNNKNYKKKIAILEIGNIQISPTVLRSINNMDAVVVFSNQDKKKLREGGYSGRVIDLEGPHFIDLDSSNQISDQFILDRNNVNKNILFTIIPNIYSFESNFIDLLVCYFNSFNKIDNKILVVASGNETKEVKENIKKIKMSIPNNRSLPNVGIIKIQDYKKGLEICGRYIDASCDFKMRDEHVMCIINKIPMVSPRPVSFYPYEVKRSPKILHAKSSEKNQTNAFWQSPDACDLINSFKKIKRNSENNAEEEKQFLSGLQSNFIKKQMDSIREIVDVCYE